jgi:hypothetical protein
MMPKLDKMESMGDRVTIYDTTQRDGAQCTGISHARPLHPVRP